MRDPFAYPENSGALDRARELTPSPEREQANLFQDFLDTQPVADILMLWYQFKKAEGGGAQTRRRPNRDYGERSSEEQTPEQKLRSEAIEYAYQHRIGASTVPFVGMFYDYLDLFAPHLISGDRERDADKNIRYTLAFFAHMQERHPQLLDSFMRHDLANHAYAREHGLID